MYDIAIVGAGPAGLSAAITARQRGREALVISRADQRGWLARAERIDNYPGLPAVSGPQLLAALREHAARMGAQFMDGLVQQILPMGDAYALSVGSDFVQARRVILCMGARQPRLLPGEDALLGRGVSYCGTCDGMLYRGKAVAVVAESAEAVHEAGFLAGLAAHVRYFGKPDPALNPRVEVIDARPEAILGEDRVLALRASGVDYETDGVFIFRDAVALSALLPGLLHDGPFIRVDRAMRTSLPGVFAAGDCAGKPLQAVKAAGEGCIAALSACE